MLPSEDNPKVYEVARMLPPGTHRYFYSKLGEVCIAKDQCVMAGRPIGPSKKEYFTLDKYRTKEQIEAENNRIKKEAEKKSMRKMDLKTKI